jgi:CheY-like chemotaxis protein
MASRPAVIRSKSGAPRRRSRAASFRPRILIVDADAGERQMLIDLLDTETEFRPMGAASIAQAMQAIGKLEGKTPPYGAILVDTLLPDGNGGEFCIELRRNGIRVPILILGGPDEIDVVRSLDQGANDCILRPFSRNVLLARLRAQLRASEDEVPRRPPTKEQLLRQLDIVEIALRKLEPPSGGRFHNNPPDVSAEPSALSADNWLRALQAVQNLRREFNRPHSDRSRVRGAVPILVQAMNELAGWLKKHIDTAAHQFAKSFGKAAGIAGGFKVVLAFNAHDEIDYLIHMIARWLGH